MNITIRNLGFSTQNHNAGIARKPIQSKPDVFKNQDKLSFSGWLGGGKIETIKRVIHTVDDLITNIRITVTQDNGRNGELLENSIEGSLDFVTRSLQQKEVKSKVTQILRDNRRPDRREVAITSMLNRHTNADIKLS